MGRARAIEGQSAARFRTANLVFDLSLVRRQNPSHRRDVARRVDRSGRRIERQCHSLLPRRRICVVLAANASAHHGGARARHRIPRARARLSPRARASVSDGVHADARRVPLAADARHEADVDRSRRRFGRRRSYARATRRAARERADVASLVRGGVFTVDRSRGYGRVVDRERRPMRDVSHREHRGIRRRVPRRCVAARPACVSPFRQFVRASARTPASRFA